MDRQTTPTRRNITRRDTNLKLLRSKQVAKIKRQRQAFRAKVKKQQARADLITGRQKGKLQTKLSEKQLRRQEKHIRRNIAKTRRLKYSQQGGDIAFQDVLKSRQG